MNANGPRSRTRRRSGPAALALACAVVLAGCGVRLETPPPTEPVPDAAEVVRRTAVADALLVAEQAEAAADGTRVPGPVAEELARIATATAEHAEQLGGEYDSGLDEIVADPSEASPSPSARRHSPASTLTALTDSAARTRAAANQAQPGPLGRLLASVSAAQTRYAVDLAQLIDADPPELSPAQVPQPEDEPSGEASSPEPASAGTQEVPVPPAGLSAEDLTALVLAEDSAGFALEVRAAQADGAVRERAQERARAHRTRAQGWALVAGVDGTEQDPRQVAYTVPRADTPTPDLARELEDGLARNYASLVARAEPGTRGALVALLVDSTLAAGRWGAEPVPFPGLPEQS